MSSVSLKSWDCVAKLHIKRFHNNLLLNVAEVPLFSQTFTDLECTYDKKTRLNTYVIYAIKKNFCYWRNSEKKRLNIFNESTKKTLV